MKGTKGTTPMTDPQVPSKAESEDRRLFEADQRWPLEYKTELEAHKKYEAPGSDPPLWTRRHLAMMADSEDEDADYPDHQSDIIEMHGSQVPELAERYKSIVWSSHEIGDPSVPLTKPLPSVPLQRRSAPKLRNPINSEPDWLVPELGALQEICSYYCTLDGVAGD
ncbi:MAG: hypothetical protein Q9161_009381 [Pseudevernia consocians]